MKERIAIETSKVQPSLIHFVCLVICSKLHKKKKQWQNQLSFITTLQYYLNWNNKRQRKSENQPELNQSHFQILHAFRGLEAIVQISSKQAPSTALEVLSGRKSLSKHTRLEKQTPDRFKSDYCLCKVRVNPNPLVDRLYV